MDEFLYCFIRDKKHHVYRKPFSMTYDPKETDVERMTRRFEALCKAQMPVILPGEQIVYLRTTVGMPEIFTPEEWKEIKKTHYVHESGYLSNLSPNYERVLASGLLALRETADAYGKRAIDAVIDLADRYKEEAVRIGREDVAAVLSRVPRYGATNFREALQFFRILHFSLWLEGDYHVTCGRFDRYMSPYLEKDLREGVHTRESAYELLCDFFLSFNKDSDLYFGVQQGDNGQSMVLGGVDENGNETFCLLSELCLEASERLLMIDPKINLRVGKNTPVSVYDKASKLTKAGLGFPQYANDDVVIPALEKLGYDHKDAANYAVAACWEFIIPHVGADVANIAALSFPKVVDICLHRDLTSSPDFDAFLAAVKREIVSTCDEICGSTKNLYFVPSPLMNLFIDVGVQGAKYHNFGVHGTGVATAADSLVAVKTTVFDEKSVEPEALIAAVDSDFAEEPNLLARLRNEMPKMGQDSDEVDGFGVWLLDTFADALAGRKNDLGGVWRAGTGSAMYYLWHADELGASPDGRRKGEPFGANFSPSLFADIPGPFSVVRSFTKPHFEKAINGGPLTMEFASSMFEGEDSVHKVALLVKNFIDRGGHQMQLNAVNLETMKDAQIHPDAHRQLVVRIWGWSAYFVELDKRYQDHVMKRQEYRL